MNIKNIYNNINKDNINLINIERVGYFDNFFFILFINKNKYNDFIIINSSNDNIINIDEILEIE